MLEKIAFIYTESEEQDNLFTPHHTKFDCAIQYGTNCKPYKFTYQCNTAYTMPNIKDIMYSLLLDAWSYEEARDIQDFANELGYDYFDEYEREKLCRMYDECKRTFNALHKMFTDAEIEILNEETTE